MKPINPTNMLRRLALALRNSRILALSTATNFQHQTPTAYPYKSPTYLRGYNHLHSNAFQTSSDGAAKTVNGGADDPQSQEEPSLCPGCGVSMQNKDPKAPGYFVNKTNLKHQPRKQKFWVDVNPPENTDEIVCLDPDDHVEKLTEFEGEKENRKPEKPVVCARCHSLRSYGRVNEDSVENLLPDFDFDVTVGAKLMRTSGSRSTLLMVVDLVDFDGSFPRRVAGLVSRAMEQGELAWHHGESGNVPRLLVVGTKLDLLPKQITPERLEKWVRQRCRLDGAGKVQGVHLVSAHKGWGIRNLAEQMKQMAGPRGNVWVVGAQNAGKSTLINAIGKNVGGIVSHLTEAPVPGTTLGIIRVDGILPPKAKLYDTPGILHPYQLSTRLNPQEQKMVQIRKELKPRTYRLKVGQSVHIGGLVRVDIEEASVESIYLTVWASPLIPLHLGKVENANMIKEKHFGLQLQPPISQERISELGEWQRRELNVSGNNWDINSMDIAAAGLGWLSVGLKGDAKLAVWTYDGVDITLRSALILDRARFFENAGFTVSSVVSNADRNTDLKGKKNKDAKVHSSDGPSIAIASRML